MLRRHSQAVHSRSWVASAIGKARLPVVVSLKDGTTRWLVAVDQSVHQLDRLARQVSCILLLLAVQLWIHAEVSGVEFRFRFTSIVVFCRRSISSRPRTEAMSRQSQGRYSQKPENCESDLSGCNSWHEAAPVSVTIVKLISAVPKIWPGLVQSLKPGEG